jgi:hypothetical protein
MIPQMEITYERTPVPVGPFLSDYLRDNRDEHRRTFMDD